jgi:hypothetical protein
MEDWLMSKTMKRSTTGLSRILDALDRRKATGERFYVTVVREAREAGQESTRSNGYSRHIRQ